MDADCFSFRGVFTATQNDMLYQHHGPLQWLCQSKNLNLKSAYYGQMPFLETHSHLQDEKAHSTDQNRRGDESKDTESPSPLICTVSFPRVNWQRPVNEEHDPTDCDFLVPFPKSDCPTRQSAMKTFALVKMDVLRMMECCLPRQSKT